MLDEKEKLSDYGEDAPLVRTPRVGMRGLGDFSLVTYFADEYERVGVDPKAVAYTLDLRHVGPWILALQVIGASLVMCGVSLAMPYALPRAGGSALRNLIASALVGGLLLSRPILTLHTNQLQRMAPPLRHAFRTLRNCALCILGAWVCEGLLYSDCVENDGHAIHALRHGIMAISFVGMVLAACFRVVFPTSASDVHVAVALACLVVLVCAPQSQYWQNNPLERKLGFVDGLVRGIRVVLFSVAYTGAALAAAPARIFELDPLILTMRAFAATAWVLAAPPVLLSIVPFYCAALCMRRARVEAPDHAPVVVQGVCANAEHENVIDIEPRAALPHKTTTQTISEERQRVLLTKLRGTP